MTLDEFDNLCAHSSRDEWTVVPCWGARSGPSYLDQFRAGNPGDPLEHYEQSVRASYQPNLAVGLAWGLDLTPDREDGWWEPWVEKFSDKEASAHFIDLLYSGTLVDRRVYVSVDGGRCMLPVPRKDYAEDTPTGGQVTAYWISRRAYAFFRLIDSLEKESDFDYYVQQAEFEVRD